MSRQAVPPHVQPPTAPARRRHSIGSVLLDACAPPVTFLVANSLLDTRLAAVIALVIALAVGGVRRFRGEPLGVVVASTALVCLHSVSAFTVGEGRAYFLPELAVNGVALLLCAVSLALGRPLTGFVCRRLGVEPADVDPSSAAVRHRLLTLGWVALAIAHLVLLVTFYVADSLTALTATAAFDKITTVALAGFTAVAVRRTPRLAAPSPTTEQRAR